MVMAGFSLEKFVESPTVEELLVLKKADLLQVANHYQVADVKSYTGVKLR